MRRLSSSGYDLMTKYPLAHLFDARGWKPVLNVEWFVYILSGSELKDRARVLVRRAPPITAFVGMLFV